MSMEHSGRSSTVEKEPKHLSFEEQWKHPERINFSGEEIQIFDISPESLKTEVPTAVVPGWGANPRTLKNNIHELVDEGRRTISVSAPHGIDYRTEELSADELHGMPDAELRKVAALLNGLDTKDVEKVDAVGHSEGCLVLVLAASLSPERFRNIVLVNPAGVIGKDTFPRLVKSFMSDLLKAYVQEIAEKRFVKPLLRLQRDTAASLGSPMHALREVLAISDAQLHDMLVALRKKGIGISIVAAVEDGVFPIERMREVITEDMVDGFYAVKGHHTQFIFEAGTYMPLVNSALDAMERKQKSSTQEEQ